MAPGFTGLHHLKFPVSDLAAGIAWFERALSATRIERLDHRDREGNLFGVIMTLPGVGVPIELRLAPDAAAAMAGFDPVTLAVADRAALDAWADHLDACSVEHSPVITGLAGQLIEFATPDGIAIRCYTQTEGGAVNARLDQARAEFDSPWLDRKPVVG